MSQENVEIVLHYLAHAADAPEKVWGVFADDVEWDLADIGRPDYPTTSHGPDAVREFFRHWIGSFENWGYEVEEVVDHADAVAVHIRQWGRGKGSGASVDGRFWQIWFLRDGKAVRVTHRASKAEALEAVGLRE
jgi:ketosteroid isomerase-like protein